jgi:signal transduction histidine kinase
MGRRWSLRTRFVAAAALCLLPLIGVALFVINSTLQHSRDQILDTEFAVSDVVSQGLIGVINDNETILTTLAQDPRVRGMTAASAQDALTETRTTRPTLLTSLFLLDPNKKTVTFTGGIDPKDALPQFQAVVDRALSSGEPAVSNKITIAASNVDVVVVAAPVLPDPTSGTAAGQPLGVIGSMMLVDRLKATFRPASGLASGETTITIVADGQIIADSLPGDTSRASFLSNDLAAGLAQSALSGKRVRKVYTDAEGDERVAVAAPLGLTGVNWGVIVSSPSPLTYGPNRDLISRGLIALGLAVLLTLVLAVIFGEMTARPLRQLTQQAAAVTHGETNLHLQPVGRGEVAALSDAFRYMADELTTQVKGTEAAREEVAEQAERLRELLRRTVRLQEDERRRIASDIHDAVSPLITGALYQTRAARITAERLGAIEETDGATESSFNSISELLERAMAELHDVIFALRPPDLDDLGVVAAVERHVNQVSRAGLPTTLEVIGEPRRLSPEARLGVYRIVQEALHNAQRHAHADEGLVRMEWLDDRLRLTVRDNGSGFDPDQASKPTSLGLLSMRERAAAIGGVLEIASRPGAGTAIMLELTYSDEIVPETGNEPPAEPETLPDAEIAPLGEPVAEGSIREVGAA